MIRGFNRVACSSTHLARAFDAFDAVRVFWVWVECDKFDNLGKTPSVELQFMKQFDNLRARSYALRAGVCFNEVCWFLCSCHCGIIPNNGPCIRAGLLLFDSEIIPRWPIFCKRDLSLNAIDHALTSPDQRLNGPLAPSVISGTNTDMRDFVPKFPPELCP